MSFELSCDDANVWMAGLRSESIDLIITDPPYSSMERHRAIGTTTRLQKWFPVVPDGYFEPWFHQAFRVLKQNSHLYVFCRYDMGEILKKHGEGAGFRFLKPIIWHKVYRGMGYPYASMFEVVLLFSKGKRKTTTNNHGDLISIKSIRGGDHYPTEKPVELLEIFVEESSYPGEMVLDSFMGSGSTGVAAVGKGRLFMGNDMESDAVELARERMSGGKFAQTDLFSGVYDD